MRRVKRKRLLVLSLGIIVICCGGVFWAYRSRLPHKPSATVQSKPASSLFEVATGNRPEDVTHQIEQRFNISLYATYGSTLNGRYTLDLGLARDCGGATACYFGDILISSSPIATREAGTAIQLKSGTTAYFVDFTCGASCGASTLNWHERTYYYQVAKKAGSQQDVMAIAEMMQRN